MDGWMVGWMNGLVDGWMDEDIYVPPMTFLRPAGILSLRRHLWDNFRTIAAEVSHFFSEHRHIISSTVW